MTKYLLIVNYFIHINKEQWFSCCHVWLLQPLGLQLSSLLCPWDFSSKYTGVGCHCLLQRYLSYPGIKPIPPTLQADSLPSEPPGKPKNTRVGSPSLLQGIFLAQELHLGLLHWQAGSFLLAPTWEACTHFIMLKYVPSVLLRWCSGKGSTCQCKNCRRQSLAQEDPLE